MNLNMNWSKIYFLVTSKLKCIQEEVQEAQTKKIGDEQD